MLGFYSNCFVGGGLKKQFAAATKPFFAFRAELPKQLRVITRSTQRRRAPHGPETLQMRTFSFILAFAFILAGPSMAGSSDSSLPGIGTFPYSGSPVATDAAQLVASR
jgi:hypothetical protein